MKHLWHFLKSNIKYNKLELSISYGITALVFVGIAYYLKTAGGEASESIPGETFVTLSFYAMLYAFFSNKKKFNLKYLISLPLSKVKLLAVKCLSDLVFFVPAISLAFFGLIVTFPELPAAPLAILLGQAMIFVSLYLFDSDIEQPRLENARASFVNRLVYMRKIVDLWFLAACVVGVGAMVYALSFPLGIKLYFFILAMFFFIALKFNKSLKLMQDESLSYFVFKRDSFKVGWKLGLTCAPLIFGFVVGPQALFPSVYGKHQAYHMVVNNDLEGLKAVLESNPAGENLAGVEGHTLVSAAIREGKVEVLDLLLEKGYAIPWDAEITEAKNKGMRPIHMAAASRSRTMVDKILSLKEESLEERAGEFEETPLMVATKKCDTRMVDHLLAKGANPDAVNTLQETPLIAAAKGGCHGVAVLLLEKATKLTAKDKEGFSAADYLGEYHWSHYLLERKLRSMEASVQGAGRAIASEEQ